MIQSEVHSPAPKAEPAFNPASRSDYLSIGNGGDKGENSKTTRRSHLPNPELQSFHKTNGLFLQGHFQKQRGAIIVFKTRETVTRSKLPVRNGILRGRYRWGVRQHVRVCYFVFHLKTFRWAENRSPCCRGAWCRGEHSNSGMESALWSTTGKD